LTSFSFRFSPSDETKLIISVSKKVAKKAVVRNKIKRRVRAAFRGVSSNLKTGTYMFIARTGSEKIKGKELKEELSRLIRSIRN